MSQSSKAAERPTEIRAVLKAQYRAALRMLGQAIALCPDSLWVSDAGHACPCWRIAFHTLFFTHFYLQKNSRGMSRWAKHRGQLQDLSGAPAGDGEVYSKADVIEYLEFCRTHLDSWLDAMDLAASDCGFPWYPQGKLEHQINNIRHIQHHAAQLGDRLRAGIGRGLDWTLAPT